MKINKIIKPDRFEKYTIIPFEIFRTKGISMAASGLYGWLFSHDKDQEMTMQFISGHFKDGRDAITSRIKELESLGFLNREEVRIDGRFAGYNYHLCLPSDKDSTITEKTESVKTETEKPVAANPKQSKIMYNNIYNNNIQDNVQDNVQYNIQESNIP